MNELDPLEPPVASLASPALSQEDMDSDIESVELSATELDKQITKLKKKLRGDLCEELDNMSLDDLKRRIVRCQVNIADTKAAMERDEDLQRAKDTLKEYKAPYTDATKEQKAIAEYATLRLKEKT